MEIIVEIPEQEIEETIKVGIKTLLLDRLRDEFYDDSSPFWNKQIDREIDKFAKSKDFSTIMKQVIEESKEDLEKAIKERLLGNFNYREEEERWI